MYKAYAIIVYLIIWNSFSFAADNSYFTLLNADQSPSGPLAALLQLTDLEHDGTIEDVVSKTQKYWIRKEGLERCNVIDMYWDKKEQIFPLLAQIGVINAIVDICPKKDRFDYLFVHGGPLYYMHSRIALMARLLNLYKFKSLVFLTGDRPLDPVAESEEKIFERSSLFEIDQDWSWQSAKMPTTEYELNRMMFKMASKPDKWKHAPIKVITTQNPYIDRTEKKQVEFTSVGYPDKINTATSILLWLKSEPTEKPCSCLAVSNQPYVGRQDALAHSLFPSNFNITTIGLGSSEENIAVHLDNIARWLYALKEKQ